MQLASRRAPRLQVSICGTLGSRPAPKRTRSPPEECSGVGGVAAVQVPLPVGVPPGAGCGLVGRRGVGWGRRGRPSPTPPAAPTVLSRNSARSWLRAGGGSWTGDLGRKRPPGPSLGPSTPRGRGWEGAPAACWAQGALAQRPHVGGRGVALPCYTRRLPAGTDRRRFWQHSRPLGSER